MSDQRPPTARPRVGRPPKVDSAGRTTRDRLLLAAADACVEHGFEGATLADIAARADVSTPAVYNHFAGKTDLLVEAARAALDRMSPPGDGRPADPHAVARAWLQPDFADTRTLLTELHLAARRHPDMADLLATWHGDNAAVLTGAGRDLATVKAWYLVLLGLAQVESLPSLDADPRAVAAVVESVVTALFEEDS